jgi:hypothetical protein
MTYQRAERGMEKIGARPRRRRAGGAVYRAIRQAAAGWNAMKSARDAGGAISAYREEVKKTT